jgi:hypothetical protein
MSAHTYPIRSLTQPHAATDVTGVPKEYVDQKGNVLRLVKWDVADAVAIVEGSAVGITTADGTLVSADFSDCIGGHAFKGFALSVPTTAKPWFWVLAEGNGADYDLTIVTDGNVAKGDALRWTDDNLVIPAAFSSGNAKDDAIGLALAADSSTSLTAFRVKALV